MLFNHTWAIFLTNHRQPLWFQQKIKKLFGPLDSVIPRPGFHPQGIEPDVSYTKMDGIGAPSNEYEASIRHVRDTLNTWIARSPSPEIADSNDSRAVDDGTDKRPRPFVFDVFAEDVDEAC